MPRTRPDWTRSMLLCAAVYAVAFVAAAGACRLAAGRSPLLAAALADLVATVTVFAFSVSLDNSSVYDPYWSVAPVPIALYWFVRYGGTKSAAYGGAQSAAYGGAQSAAYGGAQSAAYGGALGARQLVVLALLLAWAARLTLNWARRWRGLADEDWRYADYRRLGAGYWPLSFVGFHLMPTVIVFLCCLPLVPAFSTGARSRGVLDLAALLVTAGAISIEAGADQQLRRFLRARRDPAQILDAGLWSLSRHPNYFGEVAYWWGIWLFGLAADAGWWWTIVGPIAVTVLFLSVSVPMMDRRMIARHPGYAARMVGRSGFVPCPRRRNA